MTYPAVPTEGEQVQHRRDLALAINAMLNGRSNAIGTFTLEDGATETDVLDNRFESGMVPVWVPTTANAAAAMDVMYLSDRVKGGFTVTHNNTADTDRTFLYVRAG